jgi:orotidine-5'-phosphate decarboxylase
VAGGERSAGAAGAAGDALSAVGSAGDALAGAAVGSAGDASAGGGLAGAAVGSAGDALAGDASAAVGSAGRSSAGAGGVGGVVVGLGWAGRVAALVAARESQIVLGLDPDPRALWPGSRTDGGELGAAVVAHCAALIDAAGEACVAVKPQLACFERLGLSGASALVEVVAHAHAAGLLVIADGKRGDVPVTAKVYAQALMSLGADAFTANPLLGIDALAPLVETGAGVFVLVRTSNPGARDVQDLELAEGGPLWHRLARIVAGLGGPPDAAGAGRPAGRLADVGAVLGATEPGHLARARELMPRAIFLLPGVGAQGGRVEDLAPAFAPGRAGGLVSASRSISGAHEADGGDPADRARAAAHALRELAWSL